jgi:hypothetical protein
MRLGHRHSLCRTCLQCSFRCACDWATAIHFVALVFAATRIHCILVRAICIRHTRHARHLIHIVVLVPTRYEVVRLGSTQFCRHSHPLSSSFILAAPYHLFLSCPFLSRSQSHWSSSSPRILVLIILCVVSFRNINRHSHPRHVVRTCPLFVVPSPASSPSHCHPRLHRFVVRRHVHNKTRSCSLARKCNEFP